MRGKKRKVRLRVKQVDKVVFSTTTPEVELIAREEGDEPESFIPEARYRHLLQASQPTTNSIH